MLLSKNKMKIRRISGSRLQYAVKESRISCGTASKAREIAAYLVSVGKATQFLEHKETEILRVTLRRLGREV